MSGRVNKFGLSDDVPDEIKRLVRQQCGFGCVVCGCPFFHYEHFAPPFAEAEGHRPEGIALACAGCHDPKTRRMWSAEKIAKARLDPYNLRAKTPRGFPFDLSPPVVVHIGSSAVQDVACVVKTHEGERWFELLPPEEAGAPVRISARFFDSAGNLSLEIAQNEWRPVVAQWDVEVTGPRISVRDRPGSLALVVEALPPHGIRIERLHMRRRGLGIDVTPEGRVAISRDGDTIEVEDAEFSGGDTVFLI